VRGNTALTLRGDFPSPIDAQGNPQARASCTTHLLRGWISRPLSLKGIEPFPAERNDSSLRISRRLEPRDRGDFRSPLNPIEQRAIRAPCDPRSGLSRPEPRPAFRRRLRPQGRLRFSLGNPSTGAGAAPEPARLARGRREAGGRTVRL